MNDKISKKGVVCIFSFSSVLFLFGWKSFCFRFVKTAFVVGGAVGVVGAAFVVIVVVVVIIVLSHINQIVKRIKHQTLNYI